MKSPFAPRDVQFVALALRLPPFARTKLMAGDDQIPARAISEIAHDTGFEVDGFIYVIEGWHRRGAGRSVRGLVIWHWRQAMATLIAHELLSSLLGRCCFVLGRFAFGLFALATPKKRPPKRSFG